MKGQPVLNNRRHERLSVDLLEIHGKLLFADEVRINDVSVSGLSLEADKRLNIGTEYLIRLAYGGRTISVKGVAVWSRLVKTRENPKGEGVPIYSAGMQFSAVSRDKIDELVAFIIDCTQNRFAEPSVHVLSGLRCNIRYEVDIPEMIQIRGVQEYRVKKISRGGMLVGASHGFSIDERYPMEIYLPGDRTISFKGRIASCLCVDDPDKSAYDVGVEFLDMAEDNRNVLDTFIREIKDGLAGGAGPQAMQDSV